MGKLAKHLLKQQRKTSVPWQITGDFISLPHDVTCMCYSREQNRFYVVDYSGDMIYVYNGALNYPLSSFSMNGLQTSEIVDITYLPDGIPLIKAPLLATLNNQGVVKYFSITGTGFTASTDLVAKLQLSAGEFVAGIAYAYSFQNASVMGVAVIKGATEEFGYYNNDTDAYLNNGSIALPTVSQPLGIDLFKANVDNSVGTNAFLLLSDNNNTLYDVRNDDRFNTDEWNETLLSNIDLVDVRSVCCNFGSNDIFYVVGRETSSGNYKIYEVSRG